MSGPHKRDAGDARGFGRYERQHRLIKLEDPGSFESRRKDYELADDPNSFDKRLKEYNAVLAAQGTNDPVTPVPVRSVPVSANTRQASRNRSITPRLLERYAVSLRKGPQTRHTKEELDLIDAYKAFQRRTFRTSQRVPLNNVTVKAPKPARPGLIPIERIRQWSEEASQSAEPDIAEYNDWLARNQENRQLVRDEHGTFHYRAIAR